MYVQAALRHPQYSISPSLDPQRGPTEKNVVPARKRANRPRSCRCRLSCVVNRHHGPTVMCYPLAKPSALAYVLLLGQGPAATDVSLAKRPQSAVAALRGNGCTGCYGAALRGVFWPAAPQCANGEVRRTPRFPTIMLQLLHAGRVQGLQLSTRAPRRSGQ